MCIGNQRLSDPYTLSMTLNFLLESAEKFKRLDMNEAAQQATTQAAEVMKRIDVPGYEASLKEAQLKFEEDQKRHVDPFAGISQQAARAVRNAPPIPSDATMKNAEAMLNIFLPVEDHTKPTADRIELLRKRITAVEAGISKRDAQAAFPYVMQLLLSAVPEQEISDLEFGASL